MKKRTEFVDKNGDKVQIGDKLKAVYPNEGIEGTVIGLNEDTSLKPFVVRTRFGVQYFNPGWCELG